MTLDQLKQLEQALQMAQEICHEWFCDKHPLGQSEVCKTLLEGISLLDSQAVVAIADDLPYRIIEEMGLGITFRSCTCGQLPCARLQPLREALENVRRSAALSMRSRCVERVREMVPIGDGCGWDDSYGQIWRQACAEIIAALESLPLEQGEEGKG